MAMLPPCKVKLQERSATNAAVDGIRKDVDVTSVKCEFETGNDEEGTIRKRFAKANVFFHPSFTEDLCMIAYGSEGHAGLSKNFNQPFERFLTIGKDAVNVEYSAFHRAILNISLTLT